MLPVFLRSKRKFLPLLVGKKKNHRSNDRDRRNPAHIYFLCDTVQRQYGVCCKNLPFLPLAIRMKAKVKRADGGFFAFPRRLARALCSIYFLADSLDLYRIIRSSIPPQTKMLSKTARHRKVSNLFFNSRISLFTTAKTCSTLQRMDAF